MSFCSSQSGSVVSWQCAYCQVVRTDAPFPPLGNPGAETPPYSTRFASGGFVGQNDAELAARRAACETEYTIANGWVSAPDCCISFQQSCDDGCIDIAGSGSPASCFGCPDLGTYKRFCYVYLPTCQINHRWAISEAYARAWLAANDTQRQTHFISFGHDASFNCSADQRGACCSPESPLPVKCGENVPVCECIPDAANPNRTWHQGKACNEIACGPDKRCCHCDWCCNIGQGITESQCVSAGGTVQAGNCPTSGPCPGATCPPCELDGFSLAVNNGMNAFAEVSGYQPIATIRAIDDTGPIDTVKTMHASLSCRDGENAYAAQSCNIYNRRIGTTPESRRAVSECSLSAVGDGNVYQFICAYREPCKEPPAGCVRAVA